MVINIMRLSAVFTIIAFSSFTSPAGAQAAACDSGWRFENLSIGFGGDSITGTPSVLHWFQSRVGIRHDVFARNGEGHLIHYLLVQSSNPESSESSVPLDVWYRENLSTITGSNPNLITDPVAVVHEQYVDQRYLDRHDVFAVNRNDDLIHYWWSATPPSDWHHENLTTSTSGTSIGEKIRTKPIVNNDYDSVNGLRTDVFSLNRQGHLIHYWWTRNTGWASENLTMDSNGAFLGEPFDPDQLLSVSLGLPYSSYSDVHVFGRSTDDKILYYHWRGPNRRWRFENVTLGAWGQNPDIASDMALTDVVGAFGYDPHNYGIFGFLGSGLIRYHALTPTGFWIANANTGNYGLLNNSGAVYGKPSVISSFQEIGPTGPVRRHDIFARDENRHLIHFGAIHDLYFAPTPASFHWRPKENLTTLLGGNLIDTDPVASVSALNFFAKKWYSLDHQQYVFARSANNLIMYCTVQSQGWKSRNLQTISIPRGENVSGTPVPEGNPDDTLYVYVTGRDGDLLRYWRRK